MTQKIVALTGSAVIDTRDFTSPGAQYNTDVAPRLATFVLSIAACSTNSRMGGWVEVLNMALMEDVRVGPAFPDLRQACSVCPMLCCASLILQ